MDGNMRIFDYMTTMRILRVAAVSLLSAYRRLSSWTRPGGNSENLWAGLSMEGERSLLPLERGFDSRPVHQFARALAAGNSFVLRVWCSSSILGFGPGGSGATPGRAPNPQTKPGLGSNGEDRRVRDGLSASQECQRLGDGPDRILHKKDRLPVAFRPSVKTGYGTAEDSRQVPSPIAFL